MYKPGTRIRVTEGPFQGREAVIESSIGMYYVDENWTEPPNYHAKQDDGHWITIRWDQVEKVL